MSIELDNHKIDTLRFVHLTDTHLLNQSKETFHGLNTKKSLQTALSHSQVYYPDIDFILFTGDISQTGTEESYALFESVIEQYNLPVYCVPGNHDTPGLLQRIIPDCPDDSINVVQLGRFSLILLNTWVEDKHHGMITQHCLQQLEDHLQDSSEQINIIAMHHPPVLINSKWLDELGLKNKTQFLHVINKYPQNPLLLSGHVHQEIDQQLHKLRLLVTPSTCHQFKANSEYMCHIDRPQPAYRFVQLGTTNNIDTKVHYVD